MTTSKVIIEFPSLAARERFLGWLSDGGGEYDFFESEETHAPSEDVEIKRMDYSRAFPAWGYNLVEHGPDKVVVAQYGKDQPSGERKP
jgi:hypothetical protein